MSRFEDYDPHRPLLFSIAYRMLGSVVEAEDVPLNVLTLDIADARIKAVRIVANPYKLKAVPPLQREEGPE